MFGRTGVFGREFGRVFGRVFGREFGLDIRGHRVDRHVYILVELF